MDDQPTQLLHTSECLEYAARTGRAFCITPCRDLRESNIYCGVCGHTHEGHPSDHEFRPAKYSDIVELCSTIASLRKRLTDSGMDIG